MAHVINAILYGDLKSVFYKKSLHAGMYYKCDKSYNYKCNFTAMKPEEIESFLIVVNQHANSLLQYYKNGNPKVLQKPIVTVSLSIW